MKKNLPGQGMVEYGLLIALVVVGLILILNLFGFTVRDVYCMAASKISGNEDSGTCQAEEMLCEDDFSTDFGGWSVLNGNWTVGDGKLCVNGYAHSLDNCSTSANPTDYTASLNGAQLNAGDGYGIFFRAQMTPKGLNGYIFQYDPGLKAFVFRKWVNGRELNPPFAVAPARDYDWYGEPHDIQVDVNGDTFTAYVDGVPVLTAQDSTYPSGGSGLRSWDNTQACFNGFGIESAP
jgi:Flp pilus assembly pilin Flp